MVMCFRCLSVLLSQGCLVVLVLLAVFAHGFLMELLYCRLAFVYFALRRRPALARLCWLTLCCQPYLERICHLLIQLQPQRLWQAFRLETVVSALVAVFLLKIQFPQLTPRALN